MYEGEPEMLLGDRKEGGQKFCETNLAVDQKEGKPAWQEVMSLFMGWIKYVLVLLIVLDLRGCTKDSLKCKC